MASPSVFARLQASGLRPMPSHDPGLIEPGNVDLRKQPSVPNPDGGRSTVYSFSVNLDGREVLLPRVTPDGRLLSEDEAINEYDRTGRHLGMFDTPANATAYASRLHDDYAAGKYGPSATPSEGASTYRVELEDGRVFDVEVEGTEPPTEEDIYAYMDAEASKPDPSVLARVQRDVRPMASHSAKAVDRDDPRLAGLFGSSYGGWAGDAETDARQLPASGDIVVGGAKGAANTAIGLGEMAHNYVPGVSSVNEAIYGPLPANTFRAARDEFATPSNDLQELGFAVEQTGEFLALPAGKGSLLARMATQGGGSAGLTAAQGGTAQNATTSGAIAAATPAAVRAVPVLARVLKDSAAKNVSQAFNATGKSMKRQVEQITPRILEREGVIATTRPGLVRAAEERLDDLSTQYDEAAATLPTGNRLPVDEVRQPIQEAMRSLEQTGSSGNRVPVNPQKYKALQELDSTLEQLGDQVSRETLQAFKTEWDDIVAKAGGYSDKVGDALSQAQKWAYREGASAIRRVLAEDSPTIANLNAEWSFWSKVRDVAEESVSRERPQKGALRVVGGIVGMGAGGATGTDPIDRAQNALVGGLLGAQGLRLIQSPGWKLVSAKAKSDLADALMSSDAAKVAEILSRLGASIPSQRGYVLRPMPAH